MDFKKLVGTASRCIFSSVLKEKKKKAFQYSPVTEVESSAKSRQMKTRFKLFIIGAVWNKFSWKKFKIS